jgi:hypothetical protein
MISPDSQAIACPPPGRNSTYHPVQISGTSSTFTTQVPLSGADPTLVRFSGPLPQDLGSKETTTSNVIPPCGLAFSKVDFDVADKKASGVPDAVRIFRKTDPSGTITAVRLEPRPGTVVNYKPLVTMKILDASAEADKFEVGLIQNLLSMKEEYRYSSGEVVRGRCTQDLPLRDGNPEANSDDVFMSDSEPELAKFSFQRRQARLELSDEPGIGALLNLATNPLCPGKKRGILTRMSANNEFRTWVAVRFKDASCMTRLHHIDWQTNWLATVGPDRVISGALEVKEPDGDGSPAPTLGSALSSRLCQGDDSCD